MMKMKMTMTNKMDKMNRQVCAFQVEGQIQIHAPANLCFIIFFVSSFYLEFRPPLTYSENRILILTYLSAQVVPTICLYAVCILLVYFHTSNDDVVYTGFRGLCWVRAAI